MIGLSGGRILRGRHSSKTRVNALDSYRVKNVFLRVPAERAERAKSRDPGATDRGFREFALGPGSRFARPGHV